MPDRIYKTLLVCFILAACALPAFAAQTGQGEGIVIAYEEGADRILIQHGEIPGMMGPMTMEFIVDDARILSGLKEGDKVEISIEYRKPFDWVITKISKAEPHSN